MDKTICYPTVHLLSSTKCATTQRANFFGVGLVGVIFSALVAAAASVHFDVTTAQPRAQSAVDRGLFLYYAYDGDDAARAFEQAAVLDPNLAMAYWGIALANGPDLNTPLTLERFELAARASRRMLAIDAALSVREQRFAAIMGRRYRGTFADWKQNDAAYREQMLLFARESGDENAELLAAEALLESGGLAWQNGELATESSRQALELVRNVLQRDPTSAMANHLCLHLYDLALDRTPALACAQRLDRTAFPPQAEHLAHMPAHYWIETGNYTAALTSSDRAYGLLEKLDAGSSSTDHGQRYGKHDVAVGYDAAMMLGNFAVARQWAQRMEIALDQRFDAVTALRFGRFAAAYAAIDSNEFAGPSVRGLAALHLGRTAEARTIATHLAAGAASKGYMAQLFLAQLAEAEGHNDEAVRLNETGLANQRANFSGELIPLFPAGEALGEFYRRHGDAAHAVAAFTDTLAAYPNDPRAQFGLSVVLEALGNAPEAAASRMRFDLEWKGADTDVRDALP